MNYIGFINTIIKRRSIRRYKKQIVEKEKIETLLHAAMYAPSAVNKQPWHFIIIDNRDFLNRIMEIHPNASMLKTANLAILICGDETLQHDKGYWIADCGAATENILLAAESLNLGSCWIGIYPREFRMTEIKKLFNLPQYIQPFALVSIGYPDEVKETPERFKPERIFHNVWNNPYLT